MPFLVFLDQKLEKTIVIFGISILEFAEMQKNAQNKKKIKFGTKMSHLVILGFKFEKVLSYLKSASSNLSKCKVSRKVKNTCCQYQMPDLGVFRLQF